MLENITNRRRRSVTLEKIRDINKSLTQLAPMVQARCCEQNGG